VEQARDAALEPGALRRGGLAQGRGEQRVLFQAEMARQDAAQEAPGSVQLVAQGVRVVDDLGTCCNIARYSSNSRWSC